MTDKELLLAVIRVSLRCRSVCWTSNIDAIMYLLKVLTDVPVKYEFVVHDKAKRVRCDQLRRDTTQYRKDNILGVGRMPLAPSYYFTREKGWQAVRVISTCYDDEITWLLDLLMNKRRKDILNFAIAVYLLILKPKYRKEMKFQDIKQQAKLLSLEIFETVLLFDEAKQALATRLA